MNVVPRLILIVFLLISLDLKGQETRRFRQWLAGQEIGGMVITTSRDDQGEHIDTHHWNELHRSMGGPEPVSSLPNRIEIKERASKTRDGSLRFQWTLRLSGEPLEGEASWSPAKSGTLMLLLKGGEQKRLDVPPDVLLWPEDTDARLREAARTKQAVSIKAFSFPDQLWTEMHLNPQGPEPLPGYPDAVKFKGSSTQGPATMAMEMWISPSQGEVKEIGSVSGMALLIQRADLPAPTSSAPEKGFFERTLKPIPPHPFLLWLAELKVRWTGTGLQELPEDPQQTKLSENHYRLRRAALPSPDEGKEAPVQHKPSAEDAPFLAATSLVQHQDPVFKGLLARMNPPKGASRWELAKLVTDFVYDWIGEKNLSVGFAPAQEVARTAKGDCTEHGVLAIALLRRLGVPSRGVTGLLAAGKIMAFHFWVEVKLGNRWVPIDPTFSQAPASAFRLKLGVTDLSSTGSLIWENAFGSFANGQWLPEEPWSSAIGVAGDTVQSPEGTRIQMPNHFWRLKDGELSLSSDGPISCEAVPPPDSVARREAKRFQVGKRQGWWNKKAGSLFVDLGEGRWLRLAPVNEAFAFTLLEKLRITAAKS